MSEAINVENDLDAVTVTKEDGSVDWDYKLPSGRVMRPNCGIFGLAPDMTLCEGYDDTVSTGPSRHPYGPRDHRDRAALARLMIARWTAWVDAAEDITEDGA